MLSTASWPTTPCLPVAWGEVFDKWSILEIKANKLTDAVQLANVRHERAEIERVIGDLAKFPDALKALVDTLTTINTQLWEVEDSKRECERQQRFDDHFVQLARQVYIGNDQRAAVKRDINELLGSAIREEKSYGVY